MNKKEQVPMQKHINLFSLLDDDSDEETTQTNQLTQSTQPKTIQTKEEKPKFVNSYASRAKVGMEKQNVLPPVVKTKQSNTQYKPSFTSGAQTLSSNIEDEMFKQYYGRKVYKNLDTKKTPIEDDGFKHVSRKKEKQVIECKYKNLEPNFLNLNIGNTYKVLAHHNDDQNWDYNSYHYICTLTKWVDIPKLFNTMNKTNGATKFTDFDIFIMKNEISPMWEDTENRNGSICSIKVDSLKDGYSMIKQLLIYSSNNTLMEFSPESWDKINGFSFSPKKMDNLGGDMSFYVIIKIWFKQNYANNLPIDKYFNQDIQNLLKKYSIKVKSIKPEY